ncbi:MAG TPA: ABC transporter ATP-binding protein [Terriglobales bacterium]|nr:ABC transporter ATP-binding protein [Terriglobales bacterium]
MSRALINIFDLTVCYRPKSGDPVVALDGVSLRLWAGEIVGILGESGSGKSTLASSIIQLLSAKSERHGSVLFQERELTQMNEHELRRIRGRHISLVPQDPAISLNPIIRAGTQIAEVLRAHLPLNRKERKDRVLELLRQVGFDDPDRIAASYPHQLSGGQRQRVVIAQAIACRPDLIIADEPVSKLDSPLQGQLIELIRTLVRQNNTALLWVTHDPATLVGFADRIAVMQKGRIVEEGKPQEIFRRPADAYTATFMQLSRELALGSVDARTRAANYVE